MDEARRAELKRRDRALLGRPALKIPDPFQALQGHRILILGGGGSVGTAIVRSLREVRSAIDPVVPVMIADIDEESLWRASTQEFRDAEAMDFIVADIGHSEDMKAINESWSPTIVINAAALKHVGLAEGNTRPYMRVNYLAVNVVLAEFNERTIVQISTDKAASPRGVMARSKAKGENAVIVGGQIAVRFGNVLGSSGSVLRTWDYLRRHDRRIPVHNDAQRFYMSEQEAARLILFAAVNPGLFGGYVVAPGLSPTAISDLAQRYVRFHNYPPEMIEMTPMRVGDQQTEVMVGASEYIERIPDSDIMKIHRKK